LYNAPCVIYGQQQRTVTVTHPFSPLNGQRLTIAKKTKRGGKERYICYDEAGNTTSLLTSWTSCPIENPDRALMESAGLDKVDFRYEDLLMLSELLLDIANL